MKCLDLVEKAANNTRVQGCLVGGDMTAATIGAPRNLRDVGERAAALRGVSLSARVRAHMLDGLARRG